MVIPNGSETASLVKPGTGRKNIGASEIAGCTWRVDEQFPKRERNGEPQARPGIDSQNGAKRPRDLTGLITNISHGQPQPADPANQPASRPSQPASQPNRPAAPTRRPSNSWRKVTATCPPPAGEKLTAHPQRLAGGLLAQAHLTSLLLEYGAESCSRGVSDCKCDDHSDAEVAHWNGSGRWSVRMSSGHVCTQEKADKGRSYGSPVKYPPGPARAWAEMWQAQTSPALLTGTTTYDSDTGH
ncbi:hypothetical protein FIBSPDRAFT_939848 [Athelia psychrophila]|uniref:Uncharacterized protein n=1 Tax=Athelia psychrophila TaxID=1759441 RepID=A0A167X2N7_9AGAM|nr:hypothetical protein FIBSPDRAFT_939848 [Fibularhizoctonia sp. CBS 109695]